MRSDVNALTSALLQVFQGQGGTLESLFAKTTSFSNALADNDQTVQQLIDNLNIVVGTISKDGNKFSGAIDRLERLVSGLSDDRDTIGAAIDALDKGTASLADLLTSARPPLSGTIDQLSRLAPILDSDKDRLDAAIAKAPKNYRKLVRLGVDGATIPYYLCQLGLRGTDLQGKTVTCPYLQVRCRKVHGTLMLKYRGAGLVKAGFIGVVLIVMVILVGLSPDRLISWATMVRYQALFSEAGGLAAGNPVTVSGMKVGTVSDVSLRNGDALVTFAMKGNILLGSETTAHIRTGTLLGERMLTLESAGSGTMHPMALIPVSRTSSPYSLTEAVSDLTSDTAGTNTDGAESVVGHAVGDARPDRTPNGAGLRRTHPVIANPQQPQQDPGRAVQECRRRHRGPFRTQPAGQQAHPQLRRSAASPGGAPTRDRGPAGQHVGGGQAADGDWCTTTKANWRRRWRG